MDEDNRWPLKIVHGRLHGARECAAPLDSSGGCGVWALLSRLMWDMRLRVAAAGVKGVRSVLRTKERGEEALGCRTRRCREAGGGDEIDEDTRSPSQNRVARRARRQSTSAYLSSPVELVTRPCRATFLDSSTAPCATTGRAASKHVVAAKSRRRAPLTCASAPSAECVHDG